MIYIYIYIYIYICVCVCVCVRVCIYIYIYIEDCIFRKQVFIKVGFIKDDVTLFIFNCNFSCVGIQVVKL